MTKTKTFSKKNIRATIDTLYHALDRLCDKHVRDCRDIDLQRAFRELYDAASEGEKGHMRFGRRLLGHNPPRAMPHETRTRYFVVKCILSGTRITNAIDAYSTRRDYVIGAAIREALLSLDWHADQGSTWDVSEILASCEPGTPEIREALEIFSQIDYADHLA